MAISSASNNDLAALALVLLQGQLEQLDDQALIALGAVITEMTCRWAKEAERRELARAKPAGTGMKGVASRAM